MTEVGSDKRVHLNMDGGNQSFIYPSSKGFLLLRRHTARRPASPYVRLYPLTIYGIRLALWGLFFSEITGWG